MLAPRQLIFTGLKAALIDPRTGSFDDAEEALSELERRHIALILVTSRTRAQIEPLRKKLGHNHPFVTEFGGGIFFPDGYFNVKIPGAERNGRYLCISQAQPYEEVCSALDEIAEESRVGVVGFHHMSTREIAENMGLRARDAELARNREYDEPFFFTSTDEPANARFVETARERGFIVRRGEIFWHFSAGCDPARAVRTVTKLFREATRTKLRAVGIAGNSEDLVWLRAADQAILLPGSRTREASAETQTQAGKTILPGEIPGPAGWNAAILNIIS